MNTVFRLLLLPIRAPMVLLLVAVSAYLGLHWTQPMGEVESHLRPIGDLVWSAECLQAVAVVLVCTMPLQLLQQVSSMMSASRVVSLVLTLLMVTMAGLYLLHMDVLANVLILGCAVLLARLDLVRARLVTPLWLTALALSLLVLGGVSLGRLFAFQVGVVHG